MHYYQFNIGDYRRQTHHLSLLEHGIYRALLDTYYLDESSLCGDTAKLMRSHSVRTADEKQAFENVLEDFFELTDQGYVHHKCDQIIAKYKEKSGKAKAAAEARWAKDAENMRTHSEGNANQRTKEPKNQQPKETTGDKSPLPENKFSDDDMKAAEWILGKVLELKPNLKKPNLSKWADVVRLMRERDGKTHKEITTLFKWANNDEFWRLNILSPDKLRKQWDALEIKMNGSRPSAAKGGFDDIDYGTEIRDL